jgi:hypothetical protein
MIGRVVDMETHRFSLSPEQKQLVKAQIQDVLVSREEVLFAYLHGSFLLDVPFEDIDIAVYLREDMVSGGDCGFYREAGGVARGRTDSKHCTEGDAVHGKCRRAVAQSR